MQEIWQHVRPRDVVELAFKGVKDPAERGNNQDEPLITGNAVIPFFGCVCHGLELLPFLKLERERQAHGFPARMNSLSLRLPS